MRKIFNNFSRVLCAQLLCAGLVFAGCTEGPLGSGPNTELNGNQSGNDETTRPPVGYTNLSVTCTANCYIVSQSGNYCFLVAKGNQSAEFLHLINSVSVLWESFGTDVTPNVGDLIKSVSYMDGYIAFQTADTFKEGNAVIAAMDDKGTVLWSWHIWLTDQPQGQFYNNIAGTMMDRNLGATSATKRDVGALGLLYQWGRKDPFLGSSSVSSSENAANSTITWPSAVSATDWYYNGNWIDGGGTVTYAIANPTTFIEGNSSATEGDWLNSDRDNTLWTTSDKPKSIYDPCPAGWRVPDGGDIGVWSRALGTSYEVELGGNYTGEWGANLSGKLGPVSMIWYPASGYIKCMDFETSDCGIADVGYSGYYWSASTTDYKAYCFQVWAGSPADISPAYSMTRYYGLSVRCIKE